ncbi:S8 family peptidase [Streptomyces sp. NPDC087901]|uniref:S8 family peptidase n=1 Tax=Streptomyces sp. NPDC087901 TaxID=3365818 RepID=UPI00382DF867
MQHPLRGPGARRFAAAATLVVAVTVGGPGAQAAEPQASTARSATGARAFAEEPAVAAKHLTLITGDTVAVSTASDGGQSVDILPGGAAKGAFRTATGGNGDLYVYPAGAQDAVDKGTLDRELFNVTRLLKDGRGDASTEDIPAIVDYRGTPSAASLKASTDQLPASRRTALLPRLGMAGIAVDKSDAARFVIAATQATGSTGIAKVWYDAPVKAALDKSVPQIGAPEAWAEGYDGKGTKVAILDSGADLTNADIAPRIIETRSFVAGEDVSDGYGHGTHVASTIAGTGANSGGVYKGVAPGAGLMIGKVLNNTGGGDFSDVMAGMEWAANEGADVINMSLGTAATNSTDALTEAVDSLSASTGTLFVIAAGNSGPDEVSIATPATAASALTVGAVDRDDALAAFSSRGPRIADAGIKPEITAPGVGIVAARAAGTTLGVPVDDHYITMNGTSMATPHVAGAAAIMAQRHPDWTGARIKAALTSHAKAITGQTVYEEGYGRVDVAAAVDADLDLAGTVDYGLLKWQDGNFDKRTRTLTFTNDGATETTLDLTSPVEDANGTALPEGALTFTGDSLSGSTLTLPAGSTAEVTATLDPNAVATGRYTGYLTGTAADGRTVHTPVGFIKEAPKRAVTVSFEDRFGNTPGEAELTIQGLDNTYVAGYRLKGRSSYTWRLPVGTYSIMGTVTTVDPDGNGNVPYASDVFALPEIDIRKQDQEGLSVDAGGASDLSLKVRGEKRPLEGSHFSLIMQRSSPDGPEPQQRGITDLLNSSEQKYGIIPSARAVTGDFTLSTFITEREPLQQLRLTGPRPRDITLRTPVNATRFDGTKNVRLVDAGAGAESDFAALDVKGKAVLITADNLVGITEQARLAASAGAVAMIATPPDDAPRTSLVGTGLPLPVSVAGHQDGRDLAALAAKGPVTISLTGVYESGYTYAAQFYDNGRLPASGTRSTSADDYVTVRNTFHSDGARRVGWESLDAWGPYGMPSIHTAQYLGEGGTRTDHILADPKTTYQQMVMPTTSYTSRLDGPVARYDRPGRSYGATWFGAPMHPSAHTELPCSFCRTDKGTVLTDSVGGDGDPQHSLVSGRVPTWTYFRGGEQVADLEKLMVDRAADYRIVQTTARPYLFDGVTLGTKVSTEWSFRSGAPARSTVKNCGEVIEGASVCATLPVVLTHYDLPVDVLNRAPAGKKFTLTVSGDRAKGWTGSTAMAGARVSVSYDDGATWTAAEVHRKDIDSFTVTVRHPALAKTNGFVALRTEIRDGHSARTTETITRAYALK